MEIKIDSGRKLKEQLVKGSTEECPEIRESDIRDKGGRNFFRGYKWAMDEILDTLDCMIDDGESITLTKLGVERLKQRIYTLTFKMLVRILDNEDNDED